LSFRIHKLEHKHACNNCYKLGMPAWISIILWTVISYISNILMCPIRSWCSVKGLEGCEQECIKQNKDNSTICEYFTFHEEHKEAAGAHYEDRINKKGKKYEYVVEDRTGELLHVEYEVYSHIVEGLRVVMI